MPIEVQIVDEIAPGSEESRSGLQVSSAQLTLRDLIRERVRQEVDDYNQNLPEVFHGLVQPEDSERILNGYRPRTRKPLDWQRQFETAVRIFEQNGIFVLLDGTAVGSLDEAVELQPGSEIRFLRLVPLMGG